RLPRNALPAEGIFHVTARGVDGCAIFRDDEDRRAYRRLLADACGRFDWHVHAWCQMGNHVHVVVEARRAAISAGIHRVHGRYAQRFNLRHARKGHLFGDRFATWVVRDEDHLVTTIEYVHANPVRAGLCERATDWPWSDSAPVSAADANRLATGRSGARGRRGVDEHRRREQDRYADEALADQAPAHASAPAVALDARPHEEMMEGAPGERNANERQLHQQHTPVRGFP